MTSAEAINRIAPDYFSRFRFNTTREKTLSSLTTEHSLAEEVVVDAISKIDLLVQRCYDVLKVMIQAQMSTISTPEEKAEPDLDSLIDQTIEGINRQAKDGIQHYANWLIAKG